MGRMATAGEEESREVEWIIVAGGVGLKEEVGKTAEGND